ncbi:hypothetical protein ACJJIU_08735 [Microbulbifer sp. CnH-101-E]|uniref:TackOD1 domain-containing metal-binding protein n=2 Tax=Microbulbifer TaxID=48073 RepID=UPI00403A1C10
MAGTRLYSQSRYPAHNTKPYLLISCGLALQPSWSIVLLKAEFYPPTVSTKYNRRQFAPSVGGFAISFLTDAYNYYRWPSDFNTVHPGIEKCDALVVEEPMTPQCIEKLWNSQIGLHLLPVIDLTGTLGVRADLDASNTLKADPTEYGKLIDSFNFRRSQLHPDFYNPQNDDDKILARIFVSGISLTPSYQPDSRTTVCFNTLLDSETVLHECEKMMTAELLAGSFFDRRHICNGCSASQFNVREECPECRSPNLRESFYLHHFKCAYLGPEDDFRQGEYLICPKCRMEMSHFGSDYDKPGTILICNSCGKSSSETEVGFLCLNCDTHIDGDSVKTGDIFKYSLTEKAVHYLHAGHAFLELTQQSPIFAGLPFELIVVLNKELKDWRNNESEFALLCIKYENEYLVEQEHGNRQFFHSRNQFFQSLSHSLKKVMKGEYPVTAAKGRMEDFILVSHISQKDLYKFSEEAGQRAASSLRLDVEPILQVYGPEDLS